MNALALVVGERARSDLIRSGAQRAEVTAEFDLAEHSASLDTLKAADLDDADAPNRCLLRRVIGVDGRSRAFVNGAPVNLGMVRELTEGLIDIHSQDENQRLAKRDVQLNLLDAYGVPSADRQSMTAAYRAAKKAKQALAALEAELVNAEDRRALLRYQLDELRALEPARGEFECLEAEFRRLSQAQDIQEAVRQAIDCLSDMADARRSHRQLSGIDDEHPKLLQAREALSSALQLIDDAAHDLNGYANAFDTDPAHMSQVMERLDRFHDLSRKHRVAPERLAEHAEGLASELEGQATERQNVEALQQQARQWSDEFQRTAQRVSSARKEAAQAFAFEVSTHIKALGMAGGAFLYLGVFFCLRGLGDGQTESDVFTDGHVRKNRVGLENHGDPALPTRALSFTTFPPISKTAATRCPLRPGDHTQERGFPAARWADEDHELAILDLDIDALNHVDRAVTLLDTLK